MWAEPSSLAGSPWRGRPHRSLAALVLCVALLPHDARGRESNKPLSKNEVLELLEGKVPSTRVEELARQFGISFEVTRQTEKDLRDAGGSDELMKLLRQLAPRAPTSPPRSTAAPALVIQATLGGAVTYVDDEPMGTTSPEGRLKLARLTPGEHRVRLSLAGYRDYEQKVQLKAGETTQVTASLEAVKSPAATAELPSSERAGTGTTSANDSASLGVLLAPSPHGSSKGVLVSDVVPDSPADKAGLRRGYTILSLEGRSVASPQDVQQILASHQPGFVIDITYSDGASTHTTGARLASRSSLSAPPPTTGSQGGAYPAQTPPTVNTGPTSNTVRFAVAHDHGPPPPNYCVGWMNIGNGMVQYRSVNGMHSFDIPLSAVREARKNAVYLAAQRGFHIRLKKGTNYNFAVINAQGQFQPPDALLDAIDRARGKD